MHDAMPQKSRLKLPPLDLGPETFGQKIKRLRKMRGYTQTELAEKIGLIQALVSDYERDRLRLHADLVVRFARALGVSTDELLGTEPVDEGRKVPDNRLWRRFKDIEKLPPKSRREILKVVDLLLDREDLKKKATLK